MESEPRIADSLLRIWREMAAAGKPMPPEGQLADQLDAIRSQVRERLIRLEADGLPRPKAAARSNTEPLASGTSSSRWRSGTTSRATIAGWSTPSPT